MARLSADRLSPTHGWPCCVVTTSSDLASEGDGSALTVRRGYEVEAFPSLHAAGVGMAGRGFEPVGTPYRGEHLRWHGEGDAEARVSFAPPDFVECLLHEDLVEIEEGAEVVAKVVAPDD